MEKEQGIRKPQRGIEDKVDADTEDGVSTKNYDGNSCPETIMKRPAQQGGGPTKKRPAAEDQDSHVSASQNAEQEQRIVPKEQGTGLSETMIDKINKEHALQNEQLNKWLEGAHTQL